MTKKSILIVGITSGIGRELGSYLLSNDYRVIGVGRDGEKINSLRKEFEEISDDFQLAKLDFSCEQEVDNFAKELRLSKSKIQGLVHTAGITSTLPVKSINKTRFDETMHNNVLTFMLMVSHFSHKNFIDSKMGLSIVTLSSIMAEVGQSGKSLYAASKGALRSMVKSLAIELASKGIRVNSVSPGVVNTPMVKNGVYAQDKVSYENVVNLHPLGIGEVQDVVNLVEYLISNKSKWVTGSNFTIDGGYTAI